MKKVIVSLALVVASMAANAQTYTNEYPNDIQKLAQKWVN